MVDHRCDLFSLGSVLYHAIVGETPFGGSNFTATLISVTQDTPRSIGETVPDCPAELTALVMRLLEKSPADRPQSAAEVARELRVLANKLAPQLDETVAEGTPAVASQTSRLSPQNNHKPPQRRWPLVASFGGFAETLLAVIIITIKNPDGTTTKIEVPDGATVEIVHSENDGNSLISDNTATPTDHSSTSPPISLANSEDINRKVAAWVLSQGGYVIVSWSGGGQGFITDGPLPDRAFGIFYIKFHKHVSLSDADIELLRRLPSLDTMAFSKAADQRTLTQLATLPQIADLDLASTDSELDMSPLADFPQLIYLTLQGHQLAKANVLADLKRLQTLRVVGPGEIKFDILSRCTQLRTAYFTVIPQNLTEDIVKNLQEKNPCLRVVVGEGDSMRCVGPDPTRDAAARLMATGIELTVRDVPIGPPPRPLTEADLASPRPFGVDSVMIPTRLEVNEEILAALSHSHIHYGTCKIKDRSSLTSLLSVIAEQHIRRIDVSGSKFDEVGLSYLRSMSTLRELEMYETGVTRETLDNLRRALPYAKFLTSHGDYGPLADDPGYVANRSSTSQQTAE